MNWIKSLWYKVFKPSLPKLTPVDFWTAPKGWKLKSIWSNGNLWWSIYNNSSRKDSRLYCNTSERANFDNETMGHPLAIGGVTYLAHEGSDNGAAISGNSVKRTPKLSNKLAAAVVEVDGQPCQWRSNLGETGNKLIRMTDNKELRSLLIDGIVTGAVGKWITVACGRDDGLIHLDSGMAVEGQGEFIAQTSFGNFALVKNAVYKLGANKAEKWVELPVTEVQHAIEFKGLLIVGATTGRGDFVYAVDPWNKDRAAMVCPSWVQDQSTRSLFDVTLGVDNGELYVGRASGGNNDQGKIYLMG